MDMDNHNSAPSNPFEESQTPEIEPVISQQPILSTQAKLPGKIKSKKKIFIIIFFALYMQFFSLLRVGDTFIHDTSTVTCPTNRSSNMLPCLSNGDGEEYVVIERGFPAFYTTDGWYLEKTLLAFIFYLTISSFLVITTTYAYKHVIKRK